MGDPVTIEQVGQMAQAVQSYGVERLIVAIALICLIAVAGPTVGVIIIALRRLVYGPPPADDGSGRPSLSGLRAQVEVVATDVAGVKEHLATQNGRLLTAEQERATLSQGQTELGARIGKLEKKVATFAGGSD